MKMAPVARLRRRRRLVEQSQSSADRDVPGRMTAGGAWLRTDRYELRSVDHLCGPGAEQFRAICPSLPQLKHLIDRSWYRLLILLETTRSACERNDGASHAQLRICLSMSRALRMYSCASAASGDMLLRSLVKAHTNACCGGCGTQEDSIKSGI